MFWRNSPLVAQDVIEHAGETKGCVITEDSCLLKIEEGDQQVQRGPRHDAILSLSLFTLTFQGRKS